MAIAIEQFDVEHEMFAFVRVGDEQSLSSTVVLHTINILMYTVSGKKC